MGQPDNHLDPLPGAQRGNRTESAALGMVLFVAVFAFLLASFPARNSDLWLHLSSGRQLAQDPVQAISHIMSDQSSQTWLFDVVCYGLYSLAGGPVLVFSKALLVVWLGLVLLRLGPKDPATLIPVVCTCMTLVAMSTRLLLQPATASYLMLALTLCFLRPCDRTSRPSLWPSWQLVILFVVWSNVDRRVLLGLGTVALVWLGEALDGTGVRGFIRRAFSLVVLTAACLLNPAHLSVFALPPELAWLGSADSSALPVAWRQAASPLQFPYLSNFGPTPAGLAYFLLLGLGLVTFFVNSPSWRWQRFLPWLGLALVSAFQVRSVPFFAVLAGPVLAWNLQEILAQRTQPQLDGFVRRQVLWRRLTVILGAGCLLAAWPGWLQAPPFEPRRWAVEVPASVEGGAAVTRRWHQEGRLGPEAHGLHLSQETAQAFSWFCPEQKIAADDGLTSAILNDHGATQTWAERLRSARVNHLIVYGPDGSRLFTGLGRLLADPEQWPLLYLEGNLAVFGWRDPARAGAKDPFDGWQLDLDRLAFRPAADKKAPPANGREPQPRFWWDAFWKLAPQRSVHRDEATLHLLHAEVLRRTAPRRHQVSWAAGQVAALVAAAVGWSGPSGLMEVQPRLGLFHALIHPETLTTGNMPAVARFVLTCQHMYVLQRDDMSPALLYLAVRAARRALAINPDDARANLVLGESYLRLLHSTRERAWGAQLKQWMQLRQVQASAALNQAVSIQPDLAQAHLNLGRLYQEMGYLDLALKHLEDHHKLVREASPLPGIGTEQLNEQEAQLAKDTGRLAQVVEYQQKKYAAEAPRLRVLDRALLAVRLGLGGKARDLLLASDIAMFGRQGMALELELLLKTGRVHEVLEWMKPEQKALLGAPLYHWLRCQALACSADYVQARRELAQLVLALRGMHVREQMALLVGQAVLDEQPGAESVLRLCWQALRQTDMRKRLAGMVGNLNEEANATLFLGLLALEEGETNEAVAAFRSVPFRDGQVMMTGSDLPSDPGVIAQALLTLLR